MIQSNFAIHRILCSSRYVLGVYVFHRHCGKLLPAPTIGTWAGHHISSMEPWNFIVKEREILVSLAHYIVFFKHVLNGGSGLLARLFWLLNSLFCSRVHRGAKTKKSSIRGSKADTKRLSEVWILPQIWQLVFPAVILCRTNSCILIFSPFL